MANDMSVSSLAPISSSEQVWGVSGTVSSVSSSLNISPLVGQRLTTYFPITDQQLYHRLSPTLLPYVDSLLEGSEFLHDREVIRQIIFLSNTSPPEWKFLSDNLLIQLIAQTFEKRIEYLTILSQVYERGWERAFFGAIDTKENTFYSFEIIGRVFSLFSQLLQNPAIASLETCPTYEGGGKEHLEKIRDNPAILHGRSEATPNGSRSSLRKPLFFASSSFSLLKKTAFQYLSSLSERERAPIDFYLKTFRLLEQNPRICAIDEMGKTALIRLMIATTTHEGLSSQQIISFAEWEETIDEIIEMHAVWGTEALDFFCNGISVTPSPSLDNVMRALLLLKMLSKNRTIVGQVSSLLGELGSKSCTFSDFIEKLEPFALVIEEEEAETMLKRFSGEDSGVKFALPKEHLSTIAWQYEIVQRYCEYWKELRLEQLVEKAIAISEKVQNKSAEEEKLLQLVAIGRLALCIKTGCYLYSTQILTVLGQLCYENGAIAQVKTGEGKSLVVSLLAFVCIMQKQSLHIISSSQYLAKRDRDEALPFFKAFGITTDCICDHMHREDCFRADILYGTATDFEFAIMAEMLYSTPLFIQKMKPGVRFDCVIVDELDNLTIDTALSGARLGYPAEITYEWIYRPIFLFIKRLDRLREGSLQEKVHDLREFLKEQLPDNLKASLFHVSDKQLEDWIKHAFNALYKMEENKQYIVKKDRETKNKKILIVDAENTGRIMHGSRWTGGLHEFVEIKHGIEPEKESLIPVSLVHALFYPMYRFVFGLTGTVGDLPEREEIKQIYNVDSFDVPTYRPCIREDLLPEVFLSNTDYFAAIIEKVTRSRSQGRPVLVLCETIHDSQVLGKLFVEKAVPFEILNEVQEKSEDLIIAGAGAPSAVTIATNAAGRGTNIKLEKCCKEQGGLHVLITFYPESLRVEEQARGRAGRQGEPGLSEIVISIEMLQQKNIEGQNLGFSKLHTSVGGALSANDPQILRNTVETLQQQRLSRAKVMKRTHICRADIERYCFSFVQSFYDAFNVFNDLLSDKSFLKTYAQKLSCRRLLKLQEIDEKGLNQEEIQIAREAITLLMSEQGEPTQWRTLLVRIGKRIEQRQIIQWATRFYHEYAKLVALSNIENLSATLDQLQKLAFSQIVEENPTIETDLFLFLELEIEQQYVEEVARLKDEIKRLYDAQVKDIQKYLAPSGNGIIEYLREITQISLIGI